jgi:hypothetical protein
MTNTRSLAVGFTQLRVVECNRVQKILANALGDGPWRYLDPDTLEV